jgi:protein disulfide-isomerase
LYLYDHATTSEDFAALERLTLNLVGHARLVKSDSAALAERFKISTWPRLLVVRDGRPSYFNVLAPRDMRDTPQILSWMQSVWLPIVPELTASNAKEIMEGKYVVLGVLSHKRPDEFILAKRELKNAAMEWMDKQTQLFHLERQELRDAKQLRIEEAEDRDDQRALRSAKSMRITIREDDKKQVAFAWVDGDFWERWLRTTYGINVKEGERVIINDEEVRACRFDTNLARPAFSKARKITKKSNRIFFLFLNVRIVVIGTLQPVGHPFCLLVLRFWRLFRWLLATRPNSSHGQLSDSSKLLFSTRSGSLSIIRSFLSFS